MRVAIRRSHQAEVPALLGLAARLPEWFTPRGLEHMALDFRFQHRRAADLDGNLAGFLTFLVHEGQGRITWLGVAPEFHRRGVGRALCASLEAELGCAGVPDILVDTLGDAVEYEPYARTRAFYRSIGYRDHKRVQTGDPECEESLTLRKPLPVLLHRYVAAHNKAVESGRWADLGALLAPAATLEFAGRPLGPFRGADAIVHAFKEHPPGDLLELLASELAADGCATGTYGWRQDPGVPAGRLELQPAGDRIGRLTVGFTG